VAGFRQTLDHVAVVVPDLDRAQATYTRLGFRLTPRSSHKGALEPGGPMVQWGGGNHCSMFRAGYLEVLGVTDPARYHDYILERLRRGPGLCLLALGCDDVAAAARDLRTRVREVPDELPELQRDVPCGEGTRLGRFRFVFLPESVVPETDTFYIEHLTPEVLWQPALLEQPNGVRGLDAAVLLSAEPQASAARLERVLGIAPQALDGGVRFELDRGAVEVVDGAGLAARYPGAAPPAPPRLAAARMHVADLAATRGYLERQGVAFGETPHGTLWVGPAQAEGAILELAPPPR